MGKRSLIVLLCALLLACNGEEPTPGPVAGEPDAPFFPTSDQIALPDLSASDVAPDDGPTPDVSAETVAPECTVDGDCATDGAGLCEAVRCLSGACVVESLPDGSDCSGVQGACVDNQVCQNGLCQPGTQVDCNDDNACTEDTCNPAAGCLNTPIPDCCVPQCDGKECGGDGCGGICGECALGQNCVPPGVCEGGCVPDCDGKECGDDGCGDVCGNCPDGWSCDGAGLCQQGCTPDCTGKECGDDGCGDLCGTCPGGWSCDTAGLCQQGCTADCTGKDCGDDGCGGSCGSCNAGQTCSTAGICETSCIPDCAGKECGDDGCGDVCGTCPGGWFCDSSQVCVDSCTPDCNGKECGDNGCGGSCGTCTDPETCVSNTCIDAVTGSSCGTAFIVSGGLPYSSTADTSIATDEVGFGTSDCPGLSTSFGNASNEHFYIFTPTSSGNYTFGVDGFDAVIAVVTDCNDVGNTCLGANRTTPGPESLTLWLDVNQTVIAVVEGWSDLSNVNGPYTFTVAPYDPGSCTPDCTGKDCGADGCGGQCGACGGSDVCTPAGVCGPAGLGNTCTLPYPVPAVPALATGDTDAAGSTNDHSFDAGQCPGVIGGRGGASKDDVYSLTVPSSGNYSISIINAEFGFDSVLYVASDCADVGGSCVAAADDSVSGGDESLVVYLDAGVEYVVVVDGYSNAVNEAGTYTLDIAPYDPGSCVADCASKECGDDGCGGQCGVCNGAGAICTPAGLCGNVDTGDICADPFELGGPLPLTVSGDTDTAHPNIGFSAFACPGEDSALGGGSNDHLYRFTPSSSGNHQITLDATFDSLLYVVTDCDQVNSSCLGASDTIGVEELVLWLDAGQPYVIVVDGYSNFGNYSGSYDLTIADYDPGSCTPDCTGKDCGDDGCGGQCGVCNTPGDGCSPAGVCAPLGAGDDCTTPFVVDTLPATLVGSTETATGVYGFDAGNCPGESSGLGGAGRDHVYAVTPTSSGNYEVTMDPESSFDSVIYVSSVCGDFATSCVGAADNGASGTSESLVVWFNAGETYYVYVDGYSSGNFGDYTMTIGPYDPGSCTPDCTNKVCGTDGCGGQCGQCAAGTEQCSPAGQCELIGSGDTCGLPYTVDSVPLAASGTTQFASNTFSVDSGACQKGDQSGLGGGSADHVYAFSPPSDGNYEFSLDPAGGFDAALYLVTDCTDPSASCLNADDGGASGSVESFVEYLSASLTYYVVVDGYSNFSDLKGAYDLTIDVFDPGACTPNCAGKVCGDDGCSGYCGTCAVTGDVCVGGACVDPDDGQTCAQPFVIPAIPYAASGDSSQGGTTYTGECSTGFTGDNGAASDDQVFAFTATATQTLRVSVDATGSWDGIIYVVTDCADIPGTCVGSVDGGASGATETLDFDVVSGTTYYIIVDGYSDFSNNSGTYDLNLDVAP